MGTFANHLRKNDCSQVTYYTTLHPALLDFGVLEIACSACSIKGPNGLQPIFVLFTSVFLILANMTGCNPQAENLESVEYAPLRGDDWPVSTPAEQGLDPALVARFYQNAAELETLYGLLIVKNGYLIAEKYFNKGSIGQVSGRQSATKSFTSALVGIALDQGCLTSVDQKVLIRPVFLRNEG